MKQTPYNATPQQYDSGSSTIFRSESYRQIKIVRLDLPVLFDEPEVQSLLSCSGVYIILDEYDAALSTVYIGQSNDICKRLTSPDHQERQSWTSLIVILCSMQKKEREQLESQIHNEIIKANRYCVESTSRTHPKHTPSQFQQQVLINNCMDFFVNVCQDLHLREVLHNTPHDAMPRIRQEDLLMAPKKVPAPFCIFLWKMHKIALF